MSQVPTVRVAHPNAPGAYMVINQADLRDDHEVWPEQDADFTPMPARVISMDPAERDLAARLMSVIMAQKLGLLPAEYQALPLSERYRHLQEAEREIADQLGQDNAAEASSSTVLRVAKGPRGLWFVYRGGYRGGEKVSGGFQAVEEANREAERLAEADADAARQRAASE